MTINIINEDQINSSISDVACNGNMTDLLLKSYGLCGARLDVMRDGSVRYHYSISREGDSCLFSLYSEVGEPYKKKFEKLFSAFKIVIGKPIELPCEPWLADTFTSGE